MKLRSLELKSIALFYSIVILFPNYEKDTIGFHFGLWMLSATLFLVPIILKNMKYMRFDKYDYGVLALIVCHSVPFIFLGINEGFYEILYGMLCLACPYFAMKYSLHTDDDIAFLYKFIIYSSVIVTVIGIAEFTIQQPLYDTLFGIENPDNVGYFEGSIIIYRSNYFRVSTSFTHPIYLGVYACFVLILITFQKLIWKNKKSNTVLLSFIAFLCIANIIISQSRSSIVAFGVVFIFFLVINFESYKGYKAIIIYSLLSILVLYLMFNEIFSDLLFTNVLADDADSNMIYRIDVVKEVLPILFQKFNFIGEQAFANQEFKNILLNIDVPNGFVKSYILEGALYVILSIVLWVSLIRRSYKDSRNNQISTIICFVLTYYFVCHNISLIKLQNEVILFMHFGLAARSRDPLPPTQMTMV